MALQLITAPALEPLTIAELKKQLQRGTSSGEPAPTVPTVALASPAAAGDCDDGAHRVGMTFVTADGETEIGPLSATVTIADKAVNGKIDVSAITIGGAAVTSRKVYLIPVAGGAAKLATTISNNTATTVTLSVADSALGAEAPTTNTTEDPELTLIITAIRERGELATGRAFIEQTWDYVLDGFPAAPYIEIPKAPLSSITSLKYNDTAGTEQTWAASNYVVQAPTGPRARRGRLALAFATSWPSTRGEIGDVTIRLVCGYGTAASDVPAMLRKAMLMDAGSFDQNRAGEILTSWQTVRMTLGPKSIYWSYRSHATQRLAA